MHTHIYIYTLVYTYTNLPIPLLSLFSGAITSLYPYNTNRQSPCCTRYEALSTYRSGDTLSKSG